MVPPRLKADSFLSCCAGLTKNPCRDATGRRSQLHFVRYVTSLWLYPCSITGAPELGYLYRIGMNPIPTCSPVQLGGPFGFCAFALLSELWSLDHIARLSENRFEAYSSSSAFLDYVGQNSMPEQRMCQGRVPRDTSLAQHMEVRSSGLTALAVGPPIPIFSKSPCSPPAPAPRAGVWLCGYSP